MVVLGWLCENRGGEVMLNIVTEMESFSDDYFPQILSTQVGDVGCCLGRVLGSR
jgi:hypothetical protein